MTLPNAFKFGLAAHLLAPADGRGNCGAAINTISKASGSDMRIVVWHNLPSGVAIAPFTTVPSLLILDEATSALDIATEAKLFEALRAALRTNSRSSWRPTASALLPAVIKWLI
jgi:ABC-type hemin transport system ATPase subunit